MPTTRSWAVSSLVWAMVKRFSIWEFVSVFTLIHIVWYNLVVIWWMQMKQGKTVNWLRNTSKESYLLVKQFHCCHIHLFFCIQNISVLVCYVTSLRTLIPHSLSLWLGRTNNPLAAELVLDGEELVWVSLAFFLSFLYLLFFTGVVTAAVILFRTWCKQHVTLLNVDTVLRTLMEDMRQKDRSVSEASYIDILITPTNEGGKTLLHLSFYIVTWLPSHHEDAAKFVPLWICQ